MKYSSDEIAHIYELGRLFLENGYLQKGEAVMDGLTQVAPTFYPGWLALSYVRLVNGELEGALECARQAERSEPDRPEVLIYLVITFLAVGDFNGSGTYLGEIRELIEEGVITNPLIKRLYEAQLLRYSLSVKTPTS
jgi:hypothetical protein